MSRAAFQLSFELLFDGRRGDVRPIAREEIVSRAAHLAHQISADLGVPVRLAVTDNRTTMVSFRRAPANLRLRVHHMFLYAPERIVQAIADYAGRGRRLAGSILDGYIRESEKLIRRTRTEVQPPLEPRGRCFDLQAIFDRLNQEFFQGGIRAGIGWGRLPSRRRRRSIRLGVYDHQTREIRIHPALDRPDVPAYFVEFIVYHEMLHQVFPSVRVAGRHSHHPKAFRDREKAFSRYSTAIRWERVNLRILLRG